jgi:hypothetical protein
MNDRQTQDDWGSWRQAEFWRKESFMKRSPAQRLHWLKAALVLAYRSGALKPPARGQVDGEASWGRLHFRIPERAATVHCQGFL